MNDDQKHYQHPVFEMLRLAALDSYDILDTLPEGPFDEIVKTAAERFNTPISTISLIDARRQWFKARVGLAVRQTDRADAFCTHVVANGQALIVRDTTLDDRFSCNPLVTGGPQIRFYAGAPLITPLKRCLGTLNVIDTVARPSWNERDTAALETMAAEVMLLLEKRRAARVIERALGERPADHTPAAARR